MILLKGNILYFYKNIQKITVININQFFYKFKGNIVAVLNR